MAARSVVTAMRAPFLIRLAFALYVVAEVAVFVLAVRWVGGWVTFLLMVATGLLGGWLIRKEGLRVFGAVRDAVRDGRVPDRDVGDTRVVMAAGLMLVLPGFLSDVAGLVILVPPLRPMGRRVLGRASATSPGRGRAGVSGSTRQVIRGEVVDDVDPGDD